MVDDYQNSVGGMKDDVFLEPGVPSFPVSQRRATVGPPNMGKSLIEYYVIQKSST